MDSLRNVTLSSRPSSAHPASPSQPTNDDIEAVIQMATSSRPSPDGRSGPLRDTRTQLFVGNLPYRVRWQDLKDLFRKAGTVLRADVSLGQDNRSRGYGTVLLATAEDAGRAVDMFNGYSWQTRVLEVRLDRLPAELDLASLQDEQTPDRPQLDRPASIDRPSLDRPPSMFGQDPSAGRTLFVGNLPFHVQWQDLKDLFRQAGTIARADVALGADGRSRGFGSVVFQAVEDAERAVRLFNGYDYNGRVLKVHYDKYTQSGQPTLGPTPLGQPPQGQPQPVAGHSQSLLTQPYANAFASTSSSAFPSSSSSFSSSSLGAFPSSSNSFPQPSSNVFGSSSHASSSSSSSLYGFTPHLTLPAGYTIDFGPPSPFELFGSSQLTPTQVLQQQMMEQRQQQQQQQLMDKHQQQQLLDRHHHHHQQQQQQQQQQLYQHLIEQSTRSRVFSNSKPPLDIDVDAAGRPVSSTSGRSVSGMAGATLPSSQYNGESSSSQSRGSSASLSHTSSSASVGHPSSASLSQMSSFLSHNTSGLPTSTSSLSALNRGASPSALKTGSSPSLVVAPVLKHSSSVPPLKPPLLPSGLKPQSLPSSLMPRARLASGASSRLGDTEEQWEMGLEREREWEKEREREIAQKDVLQGKEHEIRGESPPSIKTTGLGAVSTTLVSPLPTYHSLDSRQFQRGASQPPSSTHLSSQGSSQPSSSQPSSSQPSACSSRTSDHPPTSAQTSLPAPEPQHSQPTMGTTASTSKLPPKSGSSSSSSVNPTSTRTQHHPGPISLPPLTHVAFPQLSPQLIYGAYSPTQMTFRYPLQHVHVHAAQVQQAQMQQQQHLQQHAVQVQQQAQMQHQAQIQHHQPQQVAITPHGLPPITPSMPPFSFLAPTQHNRNRSSSSASSQPASPVQAHAAAGGFTLTSPSGVSTYSPGPTPFSPGVSTFAHAYSPGNVGFSFPAPPPAAYPHVHPHAHFSSFSPGIAMSPGAFWGRPGEPNPNPFINPAVGAPVHVGQGQGVPYAPPVEQQQEPKGYFDPVYFPASAYELMGESRGEKGGEDDESEGDGGGKGKHKADVGGSICRRDDEDEEERGEKGLDESSGEEPSSSENEDDVYPERGETALISRSHSMSSKERPPSLIHRAGSDPSSRIQGQVQAQQEHEEDEYGQ